MKQILAVTAISLAMIAPVAKAESIENWLGAYAGYELGNSIGSGDGRKAARVVGAVLGYRYGDRILSRPDQREPYYYEQPRIQNPVVAYCRSKVPSKYQKNSGVAESWVDGCVERVERIQSELENDAYMNALEGK